VCLNLQVVSTALAFVLLILMFFLYIYGNILMTRLIRSVSSSSGLNHNASEKSPYGKVLREMRQTSLGILFGAFLCTIFAIGNFYSMIAGWREISPVGVISTQVLLLGLLTFSVVIPGFFTMIFLRHCVERQIKKTEAGMVVVVMDSALKVTTL